MGPSEIAGVKVKEETEQVAEEQIEEEEQSWFESPSRLDELETRGLLSRILPIAPISFSGLDDTVEDTRVTPEGAAAASVDEPVVDPPSLQHLASTVLQKKRQPTGLSDDEEEEDSLSEAREVLSEVLDEVETVVDEASQGAVGGVPEASGKSLVEWESDADTEPGVDVSPGTANLSTTAQRGSATKASPLRWEGAPRPLHRSTPRQRRRSGELGRLADYNRPGLKEERVLGSNLRSGKKIRRNLNTEPIEEEEEEEQKGKEKRGAKEDE